MHEVVVEEYKVDAGDFGMRNARLEGIVCKGITGLNVVEVDAVIVNIHGVQVDLRAFVEGARALDAMKEALKNQWWTDSLYRREAVGERA